MSKKEGLNKLPNNKEERLRKVLGIISDINRKPILNVTLTLELLLQIYRENKELINLLKMAKKQYSIALSENQITENNNYEGFRSYYPFIFSDNQSYIKKLLKSRRIMLDIYKFLKLDSTNKNFLNILLDKILSDQ